MNPLEKLITELKDRQKVLTDAFTAARRNVPSASTLPADSELRPVVERLEEASDGSKIESLLASVISMIGGEDVSAYIDGRVTIAVSEQLESALAAEITKLKEAKELFSKADLELAESAAASQVRATLQKQTERNAALKEVFGALEISGVPEVVLEADDAGFNSWLASFKVRKAQLDELKLTTPGTLTEMASLEAGDAGDKAAGIKLGNWKEIMSRGNGAGSYVPPGPDDDAPDDSGDVMV
jgi:hypothetical protein